MGTNPDQLTEEIAATRGRMSETVDEVRTRVAPSQVMRRRTDSARQAVSDGSVAVAERTSEMAEEAKGRGRRVMHAAADTARDKPLLSGIAAFGAGLLVGALAPTSETEQRATRRIQQDLQEPVRDAMSESAHTVGDTVRDRAGEAAEHVRDEARGAMEEVRDEAREAADAAKERAMEAGEQVREEVRDEAERRM